MDQRASDLIAIRDLMKRQFASMTWPVGGLPDGAAFKCDFLPGAPLYPSARPVSVKLVDEFTERINGIAGTTLTSLHERLIGAQILAFGNVAVAVVACENIENQVDVNRNVEMLLLVKNGGEWKIAAQAWEKETDNMLIPDELLDHPGTGRTK